MSTGDHNPARPTPSDWGTLWEHQQAENRANFLNQHTLTAQMAELAMSTEATVKRLDHMDRRMAGLEAGVAENTGLTRGIRDAITAGRLATVAMKWLAGTIVTVASAWLAIKGLWKDAP